MATDPGLPIGTLLAAIADGQGGGAGVAGITATASFVPAVASYSAGALVSTAKDLAFTYAASGLVIPKGSLVRILTAVMKIDVTAVPSGQTSYSLPLYSATPPSAQGDQAVWTLASGDLPGYRGTVSLGTPVDLGGALYIKTQYVDFDVPLLSTSASLFAQLVTAGAFTATAVARQVFLYGIIL